MPKLVPSAKIAFAPSAAPDVVGYNLYFGPKGFVPDYNSLDSIGLDPAEYPLTTVTLKDGTVIENAIVVDTSVIGSVPEAEYDFFITAVDDVSNESDFGEAITIPLDRDPPPAVQVYGVVA